MVDFTIGLRPHAHACEVILSSRENMGMLRSNRVLVPEPRRGSGSTDLFRPKARAGSAEPFRLLRVASPRALKVLTAARDGRTGARSAVLVRERRTFMRKLLVAGVSCLALGLAGTAGVTGLSLGLAGKAFAAGQGSGSGGGQGSGSSSGGQGTGATGLSSSPGVAGGNTSGDLGSSTGAGASGTSNSTTSQREACPPGAARTGDGPCIKKGQ